MTMPLNAMADILDVLNNAVAVQRINDATLPDATEGYAATNPGKAIGAQARYYEAVQTRLNRAADQPSFNAALAMKQFKPR